jgi:DedD protein
MGLFSFGHASCSAQSTSEKRNREYKDARSDPMLPEKRRAHRRLIGALALVVAAIVGLPMILDSQPKPTVTDISIQIPKNLFVREGSHASTASMPLSSAQSFTSTHHFAVEWGLFADMAQAHAWIKRLQAMKIPAYLKHEKSSQGLAQWRVCAGPFADRASAQHAAGKLGQLSR